MGKIYIRAGKEVWLSPFHRAYVEAEAEGENEEEVRREVEKKLEEKEREVENEFRERQKKCKHDGEILEHRHLDGSVGYYCAKCGKAVSTHGGLFGDDFFEAWRKGLTRIPRY
ncbi:MAG: hypothetical protein DRN30_04610 [Thermoplasmata archaeon]|nr:MAG: hypothetical protein DRN30_04610 [Thermoplasmata archaeon]